MSAILTNPTEAELAAAVEENIYDLFRAMMLLPGSELVEGEKLCYHHSFPSNPMFKGVWRTRLAPDEADDAIERALAWFKERNAPFLFWWLGPGTTPHDLAERLAARGMISMEEVAHQLAPGMISTQSGAPCMAADLHHMNEAALTQVPPGFAIETAHDEAGLLDFKRLFIESYQVPEWAAQAWVDASLRIGFEKLPWTFYLGKLNGEPVAITILFNGGGVASVYGVGTIPSARGKGIGGAITLKPLLDARAMGYRHAVLWSSEMGIHTYQRIGFRLLNARINRYLWRSA